MHDTNEVVKQAKTTMVTAENMVSQMVAKLDDSKVLFASLSMSIDDAGLSVNEFLEMCKSHYSEEELQILSTHLKEAEAWCKDVFITAMFNSSSEVLVEEVANGKNKSSKRRFI